MRSTLAAEGLALLVALAACSSPGDDLGMPPPPDLAALERGQAAAPGSAGSTGAPGAAGAAGAARSAPAAGASGPTASTRLAIAYVDGEALDVSELLGLWWQWDSSTAREFLERALAARLASCEAQRLGLTVPPATLATRTAELSTEVRAAIAERAGSLSVEEYLRSRRGVDPARYFERLRREATEQLVAERVVRAWLLGREHALVRVIVTEDGATMQRALAGHAAGRPFDELVREFSVDPSRKDGGAIPPIVKTERSTLSRLAFETEVGAIGGPLTQDGRTFCLLVDARPTPLPGGWRELSAAVEASLRERGVSEPEFLQWRVTMESVYPVDRSPFYRLIDEPE